MGCCCCCCNDEEQNEQKLDSPRSRKCTDLFALGLYGIFWFGMVLIAIFAFGNGDIYRLLYGSDSFGNTCGRKNLPIHFSDNNSRVFPHSGGNMSDKQFLFPMDIRHPFETVWICVDKCPEQTITRVEDLSEQENHGDRSLCIYDSSPNGSIDAGMLSNLGPCPVLDVYKSRGLLNRCIPEDLVHASVEIAARIFGYLNEADTFKQMLSDVALTRYDIGWLCLLAVGISLVVVFAVRFLAPFVVYFIFFLVLVAGLGISTALFYAWYTLKERLHGGQNSTDGTQMLLMDTRNETTILVFAAIAALTTLFVLFVVCCLWPSAGVIVDLFKQSGRAVQAMPLLLFQPLGTCLLMLIFFAYWSSISLLLATSTRPVTTVLSSFPPAVPAELTVIEYNATSTIRYMFWYHVVGLIWTTEFIIACQQMIIASAVSSWYFSRDRKSLKNPIRNAITQVLYYHLGSLALGSLIITLVRIPRYICTYFYAKLSKSQNPIVLYGCGICIFLLKCLENFLKYIHQNAYTIIAIKGTSFCPAARQALQTMLANAIDVAAINTIGDFVLFLAKCSVAALTGLVAALRFKDRPELHYWAVPLILVLLFAFFIAHCFLSTYEMIIDTLYLCFAHDQDNADRTGMDEFSDTEFKDYMRDSTLKRRVLNKSWQQGHDDDANL